MTNKIEAMQMEIDLVEVSKWAGGGGLGALSLWFLNYWRGIREVKRADEVHKREGERSLSEAERLFRAEMRQDNAALKSQVDALHNARIQDEAHCDERIKAVAQELETVKKKARDEVEELLTKYTGLHRQNADQQWQIDRLKLENSRLNLVVDPNYTRIPGGKRRTDPPTSDSVPPGSS